MTKKRKNLSRERHVSTELWPGRLMIKMSKNAYFPTSTYPKPTTENTLRLSDDCKSHGLTREWPKNMLRPYHLSGGLRGLARKKYFLKFRGVVIFTTQFLPPNSNPNTWESAGKCNSSGNMLHFSGHRTESATVNFSRKSHEHLIEIKLSPGRI